MWNLKLAGRTALALLLVSAAVTNAAAPPTSRPGRAEDEVRRLRKTITGLEQEIDQLRAGTRSSFQAAQKEIDGLREQIAQLSKELAELRRQQAPSQPPVERKSFSPSGVGSIRLRNTCLTPMTVIVNGKRYRLEAGATQMLRDQPRGAFVYEVPGVQAEVERELGANETYTIHIYPR